MRHVLSLLLLLTASSAPAYEATRLSGDFSSAIFAVAAPGDTQRLFVVEQGGRIHIFDLASQSIRPTPFLDISGLVNAGGEQGLLGLAFHPDYAENGLFYVNHTSSGARCETNRCTWIAGYEVSSLDPDIALPGSRREILEIAQPYSNHNGGMIAFGPDGYLYIGMGDGGSGGDPGNRAQNTQSLLGKMLRIDVDSVEPYGIPSTNPFIGQTPLDEIWALGLRNPWRFSFDRITGDLWIGDVGQELWEEVDFQPASSAGGENYGWRLMEGEHCYNPPTDCDDGTLTLPVHEYAHANIECSITGGYRYRGSVAELWGRYIFADYCTGHMWAYDPAQEAATPILTEQSLGNIASFGEDAAGELYMLTGSGLWRIEPGDVTDVEPLGPTGLRLAPARPNPFRERVTLGLELDGPRERLDVAIYAVDGRRLRRLHSGSSAAGLLLSWDGRDDSGRALPAGVYLLRAETERERAGTRLTLLR